MAKTQKVACFVISGMMVVFWPGSVANATCGVPPDTSDPLTCVQQAVQLYEMTVRDVLGAAEATQRYVVFTNMEGVAYQRFAMTVFDPILAIGVVGPEPMVLESGGNEEAEPITVQAYAGSANGYTVEYEFDSSDLVCNTGSGAVIPSIVTGGGLAGTVWGHNVTGSSGAIPSSWLPIVTTPTMLTQTSAPSAYPFDELYMAVGAIAGFEAEGCEYENVLRFTLVGNP